MGQMDYAGHYTGSRQPPHTRLEALEIMQALLSRANIEADIADLDKLFRERWVQLSTTAHSIHDATR